MSVGWWTGIVAILAALGEGARRLIPVIVEAVKRYRDKAEKKKAEDLTERAFKDLVSLWARRAQIKGALHLCVQRSLASRIAILTSTNNGGIPHAGGQVRISCIDEETLPGVAAIKQDWDGRPASSWYEQSILLPLSEDGHVSLSTLSMPDLEPLRHAYALQEIKRCEIYIVGATPLREMVYISFGWNSDSDPTDLDRASFDALVALVGKIYREEDGLLVWSDMKHAAEKIRSRVFKREPEKEERKGIR